jgi:hypothetical protein
LEEIRSMNQTTAVNVWKGTNRITQLWDDLLSNRVPPDPVAAENVPFRMDREVSSPAAGSEKEGSTELGLLERAGFESLRMIKQALDILTAPPDEVVTNTGQKQDPTASQTALEREVVNSPFPTDPALVLTFVKVSREPDPQPGSAIDTRRMAYGLKIPMKPLHKRSILQRLFFCLRQMFAQGSHEALKENSR